MQQWIYGGVTAHLGEELTRNLTKSTEDTRSETVPQWQAHQMTLSLNMNWTWTHGMTGFIQTHQIPQIDNNIISFEHTLLKFNNPNTYVCCNSRLYMLLMSCTLYSIKVCQVNILWWQFNCIVVWQTSGGCHILIFIPDFAQILQCTVGAVAHQS